MSLVPTTGNRMQDDLCRALALEMFLSPHHVAAMARYMVAVYVDVPDGALPASSLVRLLEYLVGEAKGDIALGLNLFDAPPMGRRPNDPPSKEVAFYLTLFGSRFDILLPSEYLATAGFWRSLIALQELAHPRNSGFAVRFTGGFHGSLLMRQFEGNAVLAHHFDPLPLVGFIMLEFVNVCMEISRLDVVSAQVCIFLPIGRFFLGAASVHADAAPATAAIYRRLGTLFLDTNWTTFTDLFERVRLIALELYNVLAQRYQQTLTEWQLELATQGRLRETRGRVDSAASAATIVH